MSDYNVLLHANELLKGENRILKAELAKCREDLGHWISVNDKLPESKDDGVLVYFSETGSIETVHIQDYFDDITSGVVDGVQTYTKWYKSQKVTHWMPLPEPPAPN